MNHTMVKRLDLNILMQQPLMECNATQCPNVSFRKGGARGRDHVEASHHCTWSFPLRALRLPLPLLLNPFPYSTIPHPCYNDPKYSSQTNQ